MTFLKGIGLLLHKKAKHSRPDKVSVCKIRDVIMADIYWHTSSNIGASGVPSQVEASNNSGSTTLDNYSADRDSGEIARSTYSDSSAARINGVVSNSYIVVGSSYMNQETSLYLSGPVEESDK